MQSAACPQEAIDDVRKREKGQLPRLWMREHVDSYTVRGCVMACQWLFDRVRFLAGSLFVAGLGLAPSLFDDAGDAIADSLSLEKTL